MVVNKALGLVSDFCLTLYYIQYLYGFRGYYLGSTWMFSNKIFPNNFVCFSADKLSALLLPIYFIFFPTNFGNISEIDKTLAFKLNLRMLNFNSIRNSFETKRNLDL